MTLGSFVVRNTFRNKRRSLLTMISISFSLLLLTLMICIWRSFYVDQVAPEASRRLIIRDRVSLAFFLPAYYRDKIRSVQGVTAVAPITWFGGRYIDDRPEHFFAQLATDPDEYLKVASDKIIPPDQMKAWQLDRAGCIVDVTLANKYGWKIGDRVTLQANIFPTNLDLTIRGVYHRDPPQNGLYFNAKYLEEAVPWFKGQAGWYAAQIDSADNVSRASQEIDGMFRNSPLQTKTESEQQYLLGFVSLLGNVKMFLIAISAAVMFTVLLVSANTMAMSVRERVREVGVLKTLGFTDGNVLGMILGEALSISLLGGAFGFLLSTVLVSGVTHSPAGSFLPPLSPLQPAVATSCILTACAIGLVSSLVPALGAARLSIVDALRSTD